MKRGKKRISFLLAIVLCVLCLSACQKDEVKETGTESSAAVTTEDRTSEAGNGEGDYKVYDKPVEITFLLPAAQDISGLQAVFDECQERFNIKVTVETRVAGDEGETLIRTRLASGDMSDMFWFNSGALFRTLNPEENCLDITEEEFTSGLLELYRQTVSMDGKVYAVPGQSAQVAGILYNNVIFREHNYEVPEDWSEMMALCEQMKSDGVTAVGGTFGDTWTAQMIFLGGYYELQRIVPDFAEGFTNHTKTFADTPAAIRIFEKSNELLPYTADDYLVAKLTDGQLGIAEGRFAMWPGRTTTVNSINKVMPDKVDDIGFFAIPGDDKENTGVCMWSPDSLFINKNINEEKQEAIKQIFQFLLSKEGLELQSGAAKPYGPYMVEGAEMPDDGFQAVKDSQKYIDENRYCLALEFLSPVKGPNAPQICVEAYSGTMSAEEAAKAYDEDCEKQAKQLGLEGW
jgi:raffinose/stachyose/melibiose transport system substrate-binding protein